MTSKNTSPRMTDGCGSPTQRVHVKFIIFSCLQKAKRRPKCHTRAQFRLVRVKTAVQHPLRMLNCTVMRCSTWHLQQNKIPIGSLPVSSQKGAVLMILSCSPTETLIEGHPQGSTHS